ncbi:unnamed protein product [Caenorhabditis angaria]|uniref:Phosphoribosylformylglycinamidine synthase n=1 Tax=Caenorhabditis angaria TaxID=860376 RepID=A0A9P1IK64_9PELO|nr:unnamed protein product [Caenorhabditis angaria]
MENFHLKFFADNPKSPKKLGDLEIPTEFCYHIITNQIDFYEVNKEKLDVLLSHSPFQKDSAIRKTSKFSKNVIEIGPRVAVKTAMCSNILSAFETAGIKNISRIERSIRYETTKNDLFELLADKMTEQIYDENVNFENNYKEIENFYEIDILSDKSALEKANLELGLALDNSDIEFYYDYFANKLGRNPTDVELFDLAQSDSEHSRHWFFRGNLKIDGKLVEGGSLMSKIRKTLDTSNKNSLIAFHDNSSSIKGFENVSRLRPNNPTTASSFDIHNSPSNLIYSAETHNFPTGVCPFQGATTGTGGRIRDIHSTGRGAYEIAASVGYSFGNLNIPGWLMEWEDEIEKRESYPKSLSEPLKIAIEASNGASDYGNKFGEPVICGFARSFGQRIGGERIEYVKPIMFSGGIGSIDDDEIEKKKCEPGMIVAKIGGPVYRIGVGGGAASSVDIQGKREDFLDFAAVQRGDAEMEQKMHRIVRGCAERNEGNPLLSIHDQGAGGNGNVIKELVEGCGVIVDSSEFILGDSSISLRELWTAEYQENDAALIDPQLIDIVQKIAKREKCHISLVGKVIEDQIIQLKGPQGNAVNLDTKQLGEREKKTFELETRAKKLVPLEIPKNLKLLDALNRVLRLPSVASKRYLTCKVDRSVTGLIAQQQCVGPLHTPLADVGIVALSHFEKVRDF